MPQTVDHEDPETKRLLAPARALRSLRPNPPPPHVVEALASLLHRYTSDKPPLGQAARAARDAAMGYVQASSRERWRKADPALWTDCTAKCAVAAAALEQHLLAQHRAEAAERARRQGQPGKDWDDAKWDRRWWWSHCLEGTLHVPQTVPRYMAVTAVEKALDHLDLGDATADYEDGKVVARWNPDGEQDHERDLVKTALEEARAARHRATANTSPATRRLDGAGGAPGATTRLATTREVLDLPAEKRPERTSEMSQGSSQSNPVVDLRLLLERSGVDPDTTLVMRHVPDVPKLALRLRWFAAEQPDIYNAFQRMHGARVESSLASSTHLASFLGDGTGRALFVGLYEVGDDRRVTVDEFYAVEENKVLRDLGSRGPDADYQRRWFDLTLTEHLLPWKGRLVVSWSEGRTYARRPRPGVFELLAVHEEDQLSAAVPDPLTLTVDWADLPRLPTSWRRALGQWRGVYFIRHRPTGKGYVGSAYGVENIASRWEQYAATGHGGNRLLRPLDPGGFVFSILQLVSPLADPNEVLKLEASWKRRLHTRSPDGLNDN